MDAQKYKLIIVFVGLPASGKSYTSNHLKQYLSWLGFKIDIFNCGDYRRKISKSKQDADFFDTSNKKNFKLKESYFYYTMFDLNTYFSVKDGDIGILDVTNSTKKRRNKIIKFFHFFHIIKNNFFRKYY